MNFITSFFSNLSDKKILIFIFIVGFVVYFNSLGNGFVSDDFSNIKNNPAVTSLNIPLLFATGDFNDKGSNQGNNYYRPITSTIYSLVYFIGQGNSFAFHLIQVLLHTSNAILIYFLFRSFFKKNISMVLALIFLTHPINTEAVCYISILQDVLCLFFGLLALYFAGKKDIFYNNFLIPLFLLLSILSKETGILFLFLVPFYIVVFRKRNILPYIFYSVLVLLIYIFLRFEYAKVFFNHLKISSIMDIALMKRLMNIPKIVFFYIKTFFYPKDLLVYQNWLVKDFNFKDFYLPLFIDSVFVGALAILGFISFKKNSAFLKIFTFFCGWFLIGLLAHLQIFPLDQIVADRWFYLPIVGLLGLIGLSFSYITVKLKADPFITILAVLLLIFIFSFRTIVRNNNWKDASTLVQHDIILNSSSYQLEDELGAAALNQNDMTQAELHYQKSAKLFPGYITFTNLAYTYAIEGKKEQAIKTYYAALTFGDFYRTYNDLSLLLISMKRLKEAQTLLTKGLKIFPKDYELWMDMGLVKYMQGDNVGATQAASKGYSLYPSENNMNVLNAIKNNQQINIQPR